MLDVEFAAQEWVIEVNPLASIVEVDSRPIEVIEVAGAQSLHGMNGERLMPDVEFATQEWVIEMNPLTSIVEVDSRPIEVIEVAGAQGPAGANGVGGSVGGSVGYIHTQTTLSNAWSINHHLGRKPSITVINDDTTIEGTVIHNSNDVAVVTFASSINGTAYCI